MSRLRVKGSPAPPEDEHAPYAEEREERQACRHYRYTLKKESRKVKHYGRRARVKEEPALHGEFGDRQKVKRGLHYHQDVKKGYRPSRHLKFWLVFHITACLLLMTVSNIRALLGGESRGKI